MSDPDRRNGAEEMLATHEVFWQSYADRDLERRFSVCSADVTFIGTGHHEHAVGRDQYRAMNQKGVEQYPDHFSIEFAWKQAHVLGDTGWVESESVWTKKAHDHCVRDTIRLTTVFHRTDGNWWVVHVHGSVPDHRLHDGEYLLHAGLRERNQELEQQVMERTLELRLEKFRSDDLLHNILPAEVAEELKANGRLKARHHEQVTVMMTDFVNFTGMGSRFTPQELVDELNTCFTAFDRMLEGRRVEKIKTVGDAYIAVAGLPTAYAEHASEAVELALDIRDFMRERKEHMGDRTFEIRIGVHTGEVMAGIVGIRKFAYDIWGDTVNTAARLEQNCLGGQVNISATTHALVKDRFLCSYRGEIDAKNKGKLKMYFAERTR